METNKMTITYTGERTDFKDDAMIDAAKKAGFELWASEYNFKTQTRDMSFEEVE